MSFEPQDLTGALLSQRYRLERRVGYGGMGTVYATDQTHEGTPLAVKILNIDAMDNEDVIVRFIDEGRLSRRLSHPNIIRIFDVEVAENGAPYLVMELLKGVPLSAYTANGGRVPPVQCATIILGILAALAHAHEQGIVHRDLKPDNVFLARDAQGSFSVKLLDFGIAKVMDLAGGMGKRTRTGALLGTPAYMSPEQIRSTKDVDLRSDLFSVAVMAYEMLTGMPAFPAPTEFAKLAAVLSSQPTPAAQIDPALAPLSAFLERGLQKDRQARFQTANEMATALAMAQGLPLPGVPGAHASAAHASVHGQSGQTGSVPVYFTPSVVHPPGGGQNVGHQVGPIAVGHARPSTGAGSPPAHGAPQVSAGYGARPVTVAHTPHSGMHAEGQGDAGHFQSGAYGRLSSLPEVPSVARPLLPQSMALGDGRGAYPSDPMSRSSFPSGLPSPLHHTPNATLAIGDAVSGPSGTLNSRKSHLDRLSPVGHGFGGTLPSHDVPILEHPAARVGLAPRVVAAVVLLAFVLGALAGFLAGRASL